MGRVVPAAIPQAQIGVDENGLGPRLGPMIVTAVRLRVDTARIRTPRIFANAAARAGIGDSKAACAHGAMGDAEGRVLALLNVHRETRVESLQALARAVGLDDESALQSHCPDAGDAPHACWRDPVLLPAFGPGVTAEHTAAALRLRADGVELREVRVGIVCAKRMNMARDAGRSRFDLDLDLMVRLAGSLRGDRSEGSITALCGKVGGRNRYGTALEPLSPLVGVLAETRERASYSVPGFGEIHFVLDGDASEPAIGMASMIGKYIRELWMHRINRFWVDAVPGVSPVSGYHEPMTAKFVAMTELARKARAVPIECFER